MTRTLYVDDRPRGKHGIGRFAREVLDRISSPRRSLGAQGNPARPRDLLEPHRLLLDDRAVVYTPGFNAGLTRAQQVVTLHDLIHLETPSERTRMKTLYYERVVRPTVRRAGLVVTVSPTSADVIGDWLSDPTVTVADVGNGCADVFFSDRVPAAPDTLRLLYVGSMKPHKRVDVAFETLARLPGATLTLVTNELEEVRRQAVAAGVDEARVRVEPDCSDERLLELYQEHSCLLFPSELEGFGLPVVEAIAAGCAVLYRRSCTSVHAIAAGVGVALDTDDPEEWAIAAAEARPRTRPDDWGSRYAWTSVADRLDGVLADFVGV